MHNMILSNLYLQKVLFALLMLIYTFVVFELGDTFIQKPLLKKALRIPLGILNAGLALAFTLVPATNDTTAYICISMVFLIEYLVCYQGNLSRILSFVLTFLLHIMTVRAVVVSIFAMATGMPINVMLQNSMLFMLSTNTTLLLLSFMVYMVKVYVTEDMGNAVAEHDDQVAFIVCWALAACVYLAFINSGVYYNELPYKFVVINQIGLAIATLTGYYIVLIFSIKVGESVLLKKKNEELYQTIENQQQFKVAILNDALDVYEINITKDILEKGFEDISGIVEKFNRKYTLLLRALITRYVYSEDAGLFLKSASIENLMAEYRNGRREAELVYRRLTSNGGYIWVKATTNIYLDNVSGDIKAVVYIKDINEEKLLELDLKYKAERDSLTNLYNKGTTEGLIADFLSATTKRPHGGALFLIDVDNFKQVNDTFGHGFGDAVLCELAEKLRAIFRNSSELEQFDSREDIIGRVGGDEFMIFMKNTVNIPLLANKAESICDAFKNTYVTVNNVSITISSSIGIAVFPENGTCFEELYKGADVALYLSKSKGKDAYSFYMGEEFAGYESKRGEIESVTGTDM